MENKAGSRRDRAVLSRRLVCLLALLGTVRAQGDEPRLDRKYAAGIRDSTPEERARWPEQAMAYLLAQSRESVAVLTKRRGIRQVGDKTAPAIVKDSMPWRFRFVRFRGRLESTAHGEYRDLIKGGSDDIGQVYIGRVRLTTGELPIRVMFVTTTLPVWIDHNESGTKRPPRQIKDGWVSGRGILVKNHIDAGKPCFLLVATSIARDYEAKPVKSLASIPFSIIEDQPTHRERPETRKLLFKIYPRTLFRLVKWAEPRAGAKGAARRAKEGLQPKPLKGKAQFAELLARPAKNRARYFGGTGALALDLHHVLPEAFPEDAANDAGIRSYLTGWILIDNERMVQFTAPAVLRTPLKRNARIRFEGFFYKVQGYYARDDTERFVPMLVLTVLKESGNGD